MRQSWTDERLDDLNAKVDQRFDQVDQRFDRVDQRFDRVDRRFEQVDRRFEQVDRRFEQVDQRFDRVELDIREFRSEINGRFDSMQRTMLQSTVLVIVALLGIIATQL
jgi:archaellum component FlaC